MSAKPGSMRFLGIGGPMALAAILSMAACAHQGPRSTTTPPDNAISIGVLYNLSGGQAVLDTASLKGAQAAAERINRAGGVAGRPLRLLELDGATRLDVLAQRGAELAADGAVSVVVGLSDNDMVRAAAPAVVKAGKLFVTSGATSPQLPSLFPPTLFLACFGDNTQAAAAAEFAAERLHARKVVILYDETTDYTRRLARYFAARFMEVTGPLIAQISFRRDNLSLDSQLVALRALGATPELIYLAAGPSEAPPLLRRLREAGFKQPVMGGDALVAADLIAAAGDAANDVYFTTHTYLDSAAAGPAAKEFAEEYRRRFGTSPTHPFAALGYDALGLVAWAIGRAGSTEPKALLRLLESGADYQGVSGTIRYQGKDHVPNKTVSIVAIRDRQASLAASWIPARVPRP